MACKDEVALLVGDANKYLDKMAAVFTVTRPDARLASATVEYWCYLGGSIVDLVRAARKRRDEIEVGRFLKALRKHLLPSKRNPADYVTIGYGEIHRLVIEADVIAAHWAGIPPADMVLRSGGGVGTIEAYEAKFGSIAPLLALSQTM